MISQATKMFRFERQYIDEIIEHARAEAPRECCGILAGKDQEVLKLYRTANSEKSPTSFKIEPGELLHIFQELDQKNWDILGIYHSHPNGDAYPSLTDIEFTRFDTLHIIVSLNKDRPVVRAFRINEGQVREEMLASNIT